MNNPYWQRISAIADRQRKKGIETYGKGIEENPEELHKRIEMALEELVDLGMYLCWVDDKLTETASCDSDAAHWTEVRKKDGDWCDRRRFYCSACGDWNTYGKTDFCPYCGAKMAKDEVTNDV